MTDVTGKDEIKLLDDERKAQPLLGQFGIVFMPETLDHAGYQLVSAALVKGRAIFPKKPLALWCNGRGGTVDAALALVDLIQSDGNIDGILIGHVSSAHSVVWASCQRRYTYPHAALQVHQARGWESRYMNEDAYALNARDIAQDNETLARIYAGASNRSASWWLKRLKMVSHDDIVRLKADKLINDLDMAKPIRKRKS